MDGTKRKYVHQSLELGVALRSSSEYPAGVAKIEISPTIDHPNISKSRNIDRANESGRTTHIA
jgi:hypothetical protein